MQYVLQLCRWQVLQYPLYSPNHSPCEYDLSSQRKQPLRGIRCAEKTLNEDFGTGRRMLASQVIPMVSGASPLGGNELQANSGTTLNINRFVLVVFVAPLAPHSLRTME